MAMYDDNNLDEFDDANPPEETNNRTFLIVAGGLGLLVLVALVCLVGYFFISNNSNQTNEATAQAQLTEQAMTIEAGLTQNADSQSQTQTAAVTFTVLPTNTPVIAQASATLTETPNPATATVGAAFTQIAASTQTIIPTSTALPNTGFADDVGIPGMFAMALALVAVIFLVRRLRVVPVR